MVGGDFRGGDAREVRRQAPGETSPGNAPAGGLLRTSCRAPTSPNQDRGRGRPNRPPAGQAHQPAGDGSAGTPSDGSLSHNSGRSQAG